MRFIILCSKTYNILYILELVVDFENNLRINSGPKSDKFWRLIGPLSSSYNELQSVIVSISDLRVLGNSCHSLTMMLKGLDLLKITHALFVSRNYENSTPLCMPFMLLPKRPTMRYIFTLTVASSLYL